MIPKPPKRGPKPRRTIARSKTPIQRNSRPARMRRTAGGKAKHSADLAWAKAVRAKGRCAARGTAHVIVVEVARDVFVETVWEHLDCAGPIDAAHGFPRTFSATRIDPENGWPLCRLAHQTFTAHPKAWMDFMRRTLGEAEYERLRRKALAGPKAKESEAKR